MVLLMKNCREGISSGYFDANKSVAFEGHARPFFEARRTDA